jgi:hypothetical protein
MSIKFLQLLLYPFKKEILYYVSRLWLPEPMPIHIEYKNDSKYEVRHLFGEAPVDYHYEPFQFITPTPI